VTAAPVEDQWWMREPPTEPSQAPTAAEQPRAIRLALVDRLLSRGELAQLPEPEPLIDGTIDRRTVALVAGHFGSLKSFVLQDWAASIATGRPWMGRPVEQGSVLYVAAEGAHGLHPRFTAWEYGWHRNVPDDQLHVLPEPVNLLDAQAVAELCQLAAGRQLVVIDTLARCMVGADENSAKDMGVAVDALYRLRDATNGGTIAVAHHTGKDRATIRGSSALEAGVDTVYTTEGDARLMRMTRTKRKDGPCPDLLQVKLNPVLDSAVVVSTLGVDIRPTAHELMSTFMSTFAATGASKAELRSVADMPPASFSRALSDLVRSGALINTGTDQRPFYKTGETS
jgi:hypothetical protein